MSEYTPAEIAHKTEMNVSTVMDYILEGVLPAERKGCCYRVSEEDLNAFMDMKEKGKLPVRPPRMCGE